MKKSPIHVLAEEEAMSFLKEDLALRKEEKEPPLRTGGAEGGW